MKGPAGALHVDDGGKGGIPVLFIHSAAGNTTHWAAQLAHLRKSRRAVAMDLRGHGKSATPSDGRFTMDAYVEDIAAVVETLGLERIVIVGHSMGGAASLAYAAAHPNRVAGLFLLDPASDGRAIPKEQADALLQTLEGDQWLGVVEEYWEPMLTASSPKVREHVLAGLRSTPQATVREELRGLLTFDPVAAFGRYKGPRITVVTNLNDTPMSYQNLVPDLPVEKVQGTGHWLQLDVPDKVNALLDACLAKVR